jgi:hypothetical protein
MARETFQFLPISLSPRLPVYHLGDASMNSGHSKLIKVFNRYPFPLSSTINGLAVENMKSKFEVRIGLFEGSERLLDFDIHSHFFLDMVS